MLHEDELLDTDFIKVQNKPYVEEEVEYFKLKKTIKQMVKKHLLAKIESQKLYQLVIDEYTDMGENPDSATVNDCKEIADSSGL